MAAGMKGIGGIVMADSTEPCYFKKREHRPVIVTGCDECKIRQEITEDL